MSHSKVLDVRMCRIAALTSIGLGALGMTISFFHLDSRVGAEIAAGASGFVAGAVLLAGGLVSFSLLLLKIGADSW